MEIIISIYFTYLGIFPMLILIYLLRISIVKNFKCLDGKDVISAGVSDHHPLIHDGVVFWNVMMQGRKRGQHAYNNGFGIIENDKQYTERLKKVAAVIAEMVTDISDIENIGLCEGPIEPIHLKLFFQALKLYPGMQRFLDNTFQQQINPNYPHWGVLMLTELSNKVVKVENAYTRTPSLFDKLINRLQVWKLGNQNQEKYLALAHFPFAGDEQMVEQKSFSSSTNAYRDLITQLLRQYEDKSFIFCADFNFNPFLISQYKDRTLDKIDANNSMLFKDKAKTFATVDGILLSQREKQKFYQSQPPKTLTSQLKMEYGFFKSISAIKKLTKSSSEYDQAAKMDCFITAFLA
jgi:hypothetical protein